MSFSYAMETCEGRDEYPIHIRLLVPGSHPSTKKTLESIRLNNAKNPTNTQKEVIPVLIICPDNAWHA